MQFLYDECSSAEHAQYAAHLQSCHQCRVLVDQWRNTQQQLDQWQLPQQQSPGLTASAPQQASPDLTTPQRPRRSAAWIQWLVTTACLLLAFFLGRLSETNSPAKPQPDMAELQAEMRSAITTELKEEFRQLITEQQQTQQTLQEEQYRQMVKAMLATYAQQDFEDRQQTHSVLNELLQNQISLRHDLETLAVQAESLIMQTRQDLNRLGTRYQTTSARQHSMLWNTNVSPSLRHPTQ
jgi:hypothetical protein